MKKLILFFNTVKYLKPSQIFYRLTRLLFKSKVTDTYKDQIVTGSGVWISIDLYKEKIDINNIATFLNKKKALDFPEDWNNEKLSKLWIYNIHYFEDLLSLNSRNKTIFHKNLINQWIIDNPIGFGNGWEPYPTSLRIVNILKYWLGGADLAKNVFESLNSQASFLSNGLEKHLLGNHYFANLKALLFAGIIFKNNSWTNIATRGLLKEIPEQILDDGANFELSPMYHSIMLVDMLDIYNLSNRYPDRVEIKLKNLISTIIPKMLKFMDSMSHPDNDLSLFNDCSNNVAPSKEKIEEYAKKLNFRIPSTDLNKISIIDNQSSGYFCAINNGSKLIFDASPIGPDYIPGHAHADTLSFEFSFKNQKIFVNSGTSRYDISSERVLERGTSSHNTVIIDGKDSSEVWSSFRVAKRARILNRQHQLVGKKIIKLNASHNGYKKLIKGSIHQREIIFERNKLSIIDTISGKFDSASAYFYLHPKLNIDIEEDVLYISNDYVKIYFSVKNLSYSILDTFWSPEFGKKIPNKCIKINFKSNKLKTIFICNK